jgi:enoyl-CoA hydratase/carnithine racemase
MTVFVCMHQRRLHEATLLTAKCSVNTITTPSNVLLTALALARSICANSPDAVQATKRSLVLASEHGGVEEAFKKATHSAELQRVYDGDNLKVRLTITT